MAAKAYLDAGKLFEKEELSQSAANQAYLKTADLQCTLPKPNWPEIIPIYEKVIKNYLWKDILKSSAKPLMVKVCFCFLAFDDLIGAKKKYSYYCGEDPQFMPSREGELIDGLLIAKEESNKEMFDKNLRSFTRITPFGKVENAILAHIIDQFEGLASKEVVGEELKLDDDGDLDLR